MGTAVDVGALASLIGAACWGIVIAWRLVWVGRHLPGTGGVMTRSRVELFLRLVCGIAVLLIAASYVAVGLTRGLRVPYTWMGAHGWLILPIFFANTVLFALRVLPSRWDS